MDYIRHDLAGFATSIRIDNNELKETLPELLKSYQLAVQHKLLEPSIEKRLWPSVEKTPTEIQSKRTQP